MDVGLLFPFRNPPQWRTPWPQFYAEQLKQTQIAEELGYDTIWLTEHHFAEDGYSPSLLPIASAVATMTSRVRIGTFLLLLPLHNAVRAGTMFWRHGSGGESCYSIPYENTPPACGFHVLHSVED